ncbi:MAG: glycoside hydrolase, partial [Victivallales bacterium]|nr:glycoside hydrolase [Victivallales bacterium]
MNKDASVFPFGLPREKPDMPLSQAMERLYTRYPAPTYWWNELYSQFRYTPLQG